MRGRGLNARRQLIDGIDGARFPGLYFPIPGTPASFGHLAAGAHRPLILNWFRARRLIALGAVEGFNNKLKLTTRRSYGFRVFRVIEIALYHALGNLPEPEGTHRFC